MTVSTVDVAGMDVGVDAGMAGLDFRVLGPIEIVDNGVHVAPTAPKLRQVVSLLVLRRNSLVRTDEFVDELWGENPPASVMTTFQTYVHRLRRILVAHGGRNILRTRPGGYVLEVPDPCVDQHRFEVEARSGQELLAAGDAAAASEVLSRALAVWRGSALVDVVQGELLSAYVTRTEELRFRALGARIDADLRLGRHRELISELKALVITHRLDEHLHAALMTALYRSGRRDEALQVYRTLHHDLAEELGLTPGAEVGRIHQAMLSGLPLEHRDGTRKRIEPGRLCVDGPYDTHDPDPAEVRALGAPDDGAAGGTRAAAPPATGIAPPAQLPPDIADFTGHQAVLHRLTTELAPDREADAGRTAPHIVVISGVPGVGKTAFATRLAHRLSARFADGQLYVDLHGSTGGGRDLPATLRGLLRSLSVADAQIPDVLEEQSKLLRSTTAGRRLLLVVDDAASAAEVVPLLPGDRCCAVIVTSRRRLPELAGRDVELGLLTHEEAVELLAVIVGAERLEQERQVADRLVELAGRLPLALRCLGSRIAGMPGFPLSTVADKLARPEHRLDVLCAGGLDVRSRFDSSYHGLSRLEQGIFRLVSMLSPAGFHAAEVAELLGLETAAVERVLDRLVTERLIDMHCSAGGIRYAFSGLTLSYARELLVSNLG